MRITQQDKTLLHRLGHSQDGKNLKEYIEKICDAVADVRQGEYTQETRMAVCEIIEERLLCPLKGTSRQYSEPTEYE